MVALAIALLLAAQTRPEVLIALARDGWTAARAAAAQGGSEESLAPARRVLADLDNITQGTIWQLQGEYARAVIAAAMAAAQNEHAELELQLAHARSLSDRLATSEYPARWPLGVHDVEGELYLAVHRYLDAARAYRRAGNARGACDAYRRVLETMSGSAVDEAHAFLETCR